MSHSAAIEIAGMELERQEGMVEGTPARHPGVCDPP